MNKFVFLDIETTGVDCQNDEIISIGLWETDSQLIPTGNELEIFVKPNKSVGDSIEIHGISDDFLFDKPKFSQIENDFLNFIGNSTLIAHNGKNFDFIFLNKVLSKPLTNTLIDSLEIARKKLKKRSCRLNDLLRYYNINNDRFSEEGIEIHSSLADAILLSKVYFYLVYDDHYQDQEETFNVTTNTTNLFFNNREYNIDRIELQNHLNMIETLKLEFN